MVPYYSACGIVYNASGTVYGATGTFIALATGWSC